MFGVVSVLLVFAVLGAVLAVVTGVATTFKEVAMLYGIGGWPGRLAVIHGFAWVTVLFYVGPPESDWIAAPLVGVVLLGTLCAPFYANNRRLLEGINTWESPASRADLATATDTYLPVSGTVRLDRESIGDAKDVPWEIKPITSPFTETECAACEWAVKKKQRLSRRPTYATVDHGASAGDFVLETDTGAVGVTVDAPTLLFVFNGSFTGYSTTTDTPTRHDDAPTPESTRVSLGSSELIYCESTISDGDTITVVGPVTRETRNDSPYPTVVGTEDAQTYFIDADYDTVKKTVDSYLRWTPQIAIATLVLGWAYVGFTVVS